MYAVGKGGWQISRKKRYKDVRFNVISVICGWVSDEFPEKSVTQHLNGPHNIRRTRDTDKVTRHLPVPHKPTQVLTVSKASVP